MATILDFKPVQAGRTTPSRAAHSSAELIFFPGIRYERHEPEPAPERERKKRRHEMLVLPD
jgi:hypothetical protein